VNTKNLVVASLVGGLISLFLTNVPVVNLVNCLLCAGFWLGPLFAVWFYRRQSGAVTLGQGAAIGALAGLWSGVIGLLLSFVGLAGIQALAESYASLVPAEGVAEPIGLLESTAFNLAGVVFEIGIGAVGGLIGGALFRTKPASTPAP